MLYSGIALAEAALIGASFSPLTPVMAEEAELIHGSTIRYRCSGGEQLEATYFRLRDRSLAFVRLRIPGGRQLTLPQLASGSGARFSADRDVTWWIKGESGFLQQRDSKGEWSVSLKNCESSP